MSFWKNKNVLITGNTGFKGSWLSIFLRELGANVTGYSLSPLTTPNMYTACKLDEVVKTKIKDICDYESLDNYINDNPLDIIFHMAAQPLVIESYDNPYDTLEVNIQGTYNILESLRILNHEVVLINITTDKVYENIESNIAYKEDDKLGGHDIYSVSKACSDLITHSYRKSFFNKKDSKIKVSTARSGNVIGGGDWSDNRLVPDIVRATIDNSFLEIRNPNSTRPWQHVLEPIYGYILLAERMYHDNGFSSAWNFGPDQSQDESVSSVTKKLLEMYGKIKLYSEKKLETPYKESKLLKLDCRKTEKKLSWKSVLSIEECLSLTYSWYSHYYKSADMYATTCDQIQKYLDNYK
ncbi:MAG: CDP-glucose 4,6-dehydratase [Pseudomonadota bacterium]|nr:CDP-glucose 4,6-dehydratase [Pseudomonadota bacterium]